MSLSCISVGQLHEAGDRELRRVCVAFCTGQVIIDLKWGWYMVQSKITSRSLNLISVPLHGPLASSWDFPLRKSAKRKKMNKKKCRANTLLLFSLYHDAARQHFKTFKRNIAEGTSKLEYSTR